MTPDPTKARRFFMTNGTGSTTVMDIPAGMDAGLALLVADGMDEQRAAELLVAAHRGGRDAYAFAEHMIKLRKAFRGEGT